MAQSKRPAMVWLISILILLIGLWTAGLFLYTTALNLTHGSNDVLRSMSVQFIFQSLGLSIINVVAAISLMRLRKTAFYLFIVSLGGSILLTLTTLITASGRHAFFGIGIVGALFNWAIFAFICIYCGSLIKKGILT